MEMLCLVHCTAYVFTLSSALANNLDNVYKIIFTTVGRAHRPGPPLAMPRYRKKKMTALLVIMLECKSILN